MKPSGAAGFGLPAAASWRQGVDGVAVQPGPRHSPSRWRTSPSPDRVLRGVGFRGGDYTDAPGLLPLTGAPAIEGSTPKSTFSSPAFWPQRIVTPNYFGALGESGRTSLVLTPAQYRNDPGSTEEARTNAERAYKALDLRLYYSGEASTSYGTNQPALATAPAIGEVDAVSNGPWSSSPPGSTGDPSAGVQEAWVTWTGTGTDSGHGRWTSIDLQQDPDDSTLLDRDPTASRGAAVPRHALPRAGSERHRLGRHGHRCRRRLLGPARRGRCAHGHAVPGDRAPGLRLAAGRSRQGHRRRRRAGPSRTHGRLHRHA